MKINDSHQSSSEGRAVSSVVEHFLDTEGVRGSNPLSRTIPNEIKGFLHFPPVEKRKVITSSHNKSPADADAVETKVQ